MRSNPRITGLAPAPQFIKNSVKRDTWVAQLVKCLPSAQVMIPGSWDQVPHWAPCSVGSLLLPLLLPTPSHSLSLSLFLKKI